MKVIFWGTYDTGKPRNRILIKGLRENGVSVTECHYDLWGGVEDKSQVKGFALKLLFVLKWFACYPRLICRFLAAPKHDAIVVGYLGHLDVLVIWLFAKIRKTPVVWDVFVPLYDTVVVDRQLISRVNPLAMLLFFWEWIAARAADLVVLDTQSHAEYFIKQFGLTKAKSGAVFVGVEPDVFPVQLASKRKDIDGAITVLFYGQFIPLHGIETIIAAARILQDESIEWMLIGQGQEADKIQKILYERPLKNVVWKRWVQYEELIEHIHEADICLGIFGDSQKASRVIPNKVFQIISSGKPLITRNSPAIRELLSVEREGVLLIEPSSAKALASAVLEMKNNLYRIPYPIYEEISDCILPKTIGSDCKVLIENLTGKSM